MKLVAPLLPLLFFGSMLLVVTRGLCDDDDEAATKRALHKQLQDFLGLLNNANLDDLEVVITDRSAMYVLSIFLFSFLHCLIINLLISYLTLQYNLHRQVLEKNTHTYTAHCALLNQLHNKRRRRRRRAPSCISITRTRSSRTLLACSRQTIAM